MKILKILILFTSLLAIACTAIFQALRLIFIAASSPKNAPQGSLSLDL